MENTSENPSNSSQISNISISEDMLDIDMIMVCILPNQLTSLFESSLITLANRKNPFTDKPRYQDWLIIAISPAIIKVPAEYKEAIIQKLWSHNITIIAHDEPTLLITRAQHIGVGLLEQILSELLIPAIRIIQYGQKSPINNFMALDRILENLPDDMCGMNFFDIGITLPMDEIPLVFYYGERSVQIFPMLLELGEEIANDDESICYGSLKANLSDANMVNIRVYPRLVHWLKTSIPIEELRNTISGSLLPSRKKAIYHMQDILTHPQHRQYLGGLRIEIRVKTKTLLEAKNICMASGYFNIPELEIWLGCKLKLIKVEDYFAQITSILLAAERQSIWQIVQKDTISSYVLEAIHDIFNAFGWHPGRHIWGRIQLLTNQYQRWWKEDASILNREPNRAPIQRRINPTTQIRNIARQQQLQQVFPTMLSSENPSSFIQTQLNTIWNYFRQHRIEIKCDRCDNVLFLKQRNPVFQMICGRNRSSNPRHTMSGQVLLQRFQRFQQSQPEISIEQRLIDLENNIIIQEIMKRVIWRRAGRGYGQYEENRITYTPISTSGGQGQHFFLSELPLAAKHILEIAENGRWYQIVRCYPLNQEGQNIIYQAYLTWKCNLNNRLISQNEQSSSLTEPIEEIIIISSDSEIEEIEEIPNNSSLIQRELSNSVEIISLLSPSSSIHQIETSFNDDILSSIAQLFLEDESSNEYEFLQDIQNESNINQLQQIEYQNEVEQNNIQQIQENELELNINELQQNENQNEIEQDEIQQNQENEIQQIELSFEIQEQMINEIQWKKLRNGYFWQPSKGRVLYKKFYKTIQDACEAAWRQFGLNWRDHIKLK